MMRTRLAVLTALVTTAGLVAAPAQAKPRPDFSQTIEAGGAVIRQTLKETKSTSISVALTSKGKTVWSQQFGKITPGGAPPKAATRYGIGSVSKMITTLSVMQLVDQGKVSLDAPVTRYLPEFTVLSPQYSQITVRMLLNHSAGIPGSDYANGISYKPIAGYPQQVLSALRRSHLKSTPGAVNVYCNDCFTLAGEVVARVSGSTIEQYAAQNLFKPLGMTHTSFSVTPKTTAPVIVGGKVLPTEYTNIAASGGVVSTPQDMLKLAQVFTGERRGIVSAEAIAQMGVDQTTTTLKAGPRSELRYGLGWDDVADPALGNLTTWVKGGDVDYYHAAFLVAPEKDLAVMVSAAGTGIDSSTLEAVGGQILLRALVDTGDRARYPKPLTSLPPRVAPSAEQLNRMVGVYLSSGATSRITRVGKSLKLWRWAGAWEPHDGRFVLRKDGRFWSTTTPGTSLYLDRAWGRTYLLLRRLGGTGNYYSYIAMAQKMRSSRILPEWSARIGQVWLLANENPASTSWQVPGLQFDELPGLTGYLMGDGALVGSVPFSVGQDPNVGAMFLQIPLAMGRDLYDVDVTRHGGEEVLQLGSSVLRQKATVPALSKGTVTIGSRGFVEWVKVTADVTVTLSGQSDWKVFSPDLELADEGGSGTPTLQLKAGQYVALFGSAGAVISVS